MSGMQSATKADVITEGMAQAERAGLRTLAEMAVQEQADRLLVRTERIASEDGGWHKARPGAVAVSFCRGMAGAHPEHYVYMVGVVRIGREQAVMYTYEALSAVAKAEAQGPTEPICVPDCDADHLRICSECWRTGYRGEAPCPCRHFVIRGAAEVRA